MRSTRVSKNKTRNVLITTEWRGVFYAQVDGDTIEEWHGEKLILRNVKRSRMVIYWGTTQGIFELCYTGPTEKTKLSATADMEVLHGVTAVFAVSDKAAKKVWA